MASLVAEEGSAAAATPLRARRRGAVRGRAPGRDRHAGAGPAPVRVVRRGHRRPRRPRAGAPTTGPRASRRMVKGEMIGTDNDNQDAPPDDTGEAVGLGPEALTLTFGFGASLFDRAGDPFRIAARKPAALAPMPVFAKRRDPIPTSATATSPSRRAPTIPRSRSTPSATWRGSGAGSWPCAGRNRASGARRCTDSKQTTPRNLMGFKDGTNNIVVEDTGALDDHVWVGSEGRSRVDAQRQLPRDASHPHDARDLGPLHALRPGAHDRAQQAGGRAARAARRSTTP